MRSLRFSFFMPAVHDCLFEIDSGTGIFEFISSEPARPVVLSQKAIRLTTHGVVCMTAGAVWLTWASFMSVPPSVAVMGTVSFEEREEEDKESVGADCFGEGGARLLAGEVRAATAAAGEIRGEDGGEVE